MKIYLLCSAQVMFLIRFFAVWPLKFLHLLANLLAWVALYVIGYRKEIVLQNLQNSFPDKSIEKLKKIRKKFYRNLADVIVETLKILYVDPSELKKRCYLTNIDLLVGPVREGKIVLGLTSHTCNWEWISLAVNIHAPDCAMEVVYQPLSNTFFDKLMLKLRTRFGAKPLKKQHVLKEILGRQQEGRIIALIADQSPAGNEKDYWTTFLNQDTAFFAGAEKIALKLQLPVVFTGVRRLKRGYYEIYFEEIASPPYLPESSPLITQKYISLLEKQIREAPADWLWSHKRWKKKRNQSLMEQTRSYNRSNREPRN